MPSVSPSSSMPPKKEEESALPPPHAPASSFIPTSACTDTTTKKKAKGAFRFMEHPHRKVALRLAYHGHVHDGLAIQRHTSNTVEGLLCEALRELHLVPTTMEDHHEMLQHSSEGDTCLSTEHNRRRHRHPSDQSATAWTSNEVPVKLSRCGRTDKGVSALGNCVSLVCRSSCWPTDTPQRPPLDYATKLNGILPSTIRVVGYAEVGDDFDARFSCTARTYRYYFCHKGLDVEAMRAAGKHLEGVHAFRNFCVLDVANVGSLERRMEMVDILPSSALPEYISYVVLRANSFLYHQVRCIMSVLFLVGRHLEHPSIVSSLLCSGDRKPHYTLADSSPLVLWECHYTKTDPSVGSSSPSSSSAVSWQMSAKAMEEVQSSLLDITTALLLRATAADAMREQLRAWYPMGWDLTNRREGNRWCGESRDTFRPYTIPGSGKEVTDSTVSAPTTSSALPVFSSSPLSHHNEEVQPNKAQEEELSPIDHRVEQGDIHRPVEVYADSWSPTGWDWTLPHADDLRRTRQLSVFREKKLLATPIQEGTPLSSSIRIQGKKEEEVIERLQRHHSSTRENDEKKEMEEEEQEREKRRKSMETILFCREKVKGYVPLLLRETESTYDEQVAKLGGSKRARYEESMRKKEKYETVSNLA